MSKLSKACYAILAVKSFRLQVMLRMIYFSYVHYVMTYGVIFGENSSCGSNIFKIKKKEQLESLQILEIEILVEDYLRN
jgi:hypothetical protein